MLYYVTSGWWYFRDAQGLHMLVRGGPADRTRILHPVAAYTNKNAAEKALPGHRAGDLSAYVVKDWQALNPS